MPIRIKGPTADRHPRRKWDSIERRKERQKEYMEKHGPQQPRRKRLATTDKFKEVRAHNKYARGGKAGTGPSPGTRIKARKARAAEWWTGREGMHAVYNPTIDKKLREKRPHSSPEGRMRDVKTAYAKADKDRKRRVLPKLSRGRPARLTTTGEKLRAKHGIGSLVKKVITKIKPKPKGVFKPKPVPKSVTDKPTGWSPKGEYTKADDNKINSMLKKLGDEIKAQPLPPKTKELVKKLQKAYPHKKASGGRIGLKKGSVHKPGSHSWYLQHMNKNKKASGGRANFRHGGSVGAAVRGHGAEIK